MLDYPEIPLHNNPAEISLREFVLKKRISHGTRSKDGRIAWENMMSILDTCRKHGVSFFEYVKDIFSGEYKMTRLADLITQKALDKSAIHWAYSKKVTREFLTKAGRDILSYQRVKINLPPKDKLYPSKLCRICGESFISKDGSDSCKACAGEGYYDLIWKIILNNNNTQKC